MDKRVILWVILGVVDIVLIALYIVTVLKHPEKDKTETKPGQKEPKELSDEERHLLELEYREVCQDWRQRDKYVLDKLSTSGLLFGLIGIAFGTIGEGHEIIELCILLIGIFFSFMLAISVAKDTYYRDASEKLGGSLALRLGIPDYLQKIEPLVSKLYVDKKGDKSTLNFPRKISIKRDESSIMVWGRLRDTLLDRTTFNWILAFYLGSCLIFINLLILLLMDWRCGLDLPFSI